MTITPTKTDKRTVTPEQAFDEFRPRGYNCTAKSLDAVGKHGWEITSFTLNRTYTPPSGMEMPEMDMHETPGYYENDVQFFYNNTATDNDWPRDNQWRQCMYVTGEAQKELDGAMKLDCMMSFELFRLGFSYDNATSTLTLRQGWSCDGQDGEHT
jgi:hypothetical protein